MHYMCSAGCKHFRLTPSGFLSTVGVLAQFSLHILVGTTELYLGVMDKLWQMSPGKPIFLINGGGQGLYAALNWGDGFVTDKAIIKEYKIADANPFFSALMKKPYLSRWGSKTGMLTLPCTCATILAARTQGTRRLHCTADHSATNSLPPVRGHH